MADVPAGGGVSAEDEEGAGGKPASCKLLIAGHAKKQCLWHLSWSM